MLLFLPSLSLNATAARVGVSAKTARGWIKDHKYAETPEPTGEIKELETDEMCHYLFKKSGFGSEKPRA